MAKLWENKDFFVCWKARRKQGNCWWSSSRSNWCRKRAWTLLSVESHKILKTKRGETMQCFGTTLGSNMKLGLLLFPVLSSLTTMTSQPFFVRLLTLSTKSSATYWRLVENLLCCCYTTGRSLSTFWSQVTGEYGRR
jgi:hypothetical protein